MIDHCATLQSNLSSLSIQQMVTLQHPVDSKLLSLEKKSPKMRYRMKS